MRLEILLNAYLAIKIVKQGFNDTLIRVSPGTVSTNLQPLACWGLAVMRFKFVL